MSFARRLASGTFQLSLSNAAMRVVGVITMPILTAALTPDAYGVAALAGTLVSLVAVLGLAGIDTSYTRAYFSAEAPNGVAVERYCWRFATSGAVIAAVIAAIGWSLADVDTTGRYQGLAIIIAVGVVLSVFNTMSQTRARLNGRYRAMAIASIGAGLAAAVASIGIALFWRADALALLLPLLLTHAIPIIVLGTPSIRAFATQARLSRTDRASLVSIGLAGVVTAPMYWLLTSSDRWFLQHFQGFEAVGIYSVGSSVAMMGMVVMSAITLVWLPEAAREYEQDRERARITLGRLASRLFAGMALVWLAISAAGGDVVRWLADPRFHEAAAFVPYIAGAVLFYGIAHLALCGLVLAKQLKWSALWWIAGGVLSVLLNVLLVPRYAGLGAAITQGASFALIALGILGTSQAKYRIALERGRILAVTIVVLAAAVYLTPAWHSVPTTSLLMKLPFGLLIAILVFCIAAPDWTLRGLDRLRFRHGALRVLPRPRD